MTECYLDYLCIYLKINNLNAIFYEFIIINYLNILLIFLILINLNITKKNLILTP